MLERHQGKRYSVYNRRTGQPIYIFGTAMTPMIPT